MRARSNWWQITVAAVLVLPAMAGAQNVAFGKTTAASSNYSNSPLTQSSNAVDGIRNGNYYAGSTVHTNPDVLAWWYVDLGADYSVSSIDFYNRSDCCSSRIIGATIGVFSSMPYTGSMPAPVWSATFMSDGMTTGTPGELLTSFSPGGAVGRYVGVSQSNQYLQIAEVEVNGRSITTATPEPATVALMATGLLAVFGVARARKRSF